MGEEKPLPNVVLVHLKLASLHLDATINILFEPQYSQSFHLYCFFANGPQERHERVWKACRKGLEKISGNHEVGHLVSLCPFHRFNICAKKRLTSGK